MSVNSASSSIPAVSLAYIASPDDALDLINATQSDLTDQMRNAISSQVTVGGEIFNYTLVLFDTFPAMVQ
jgi:hypothetical protein